MYVKIVANRIIMSNVVHDLLDYSCLSNHWRRISCTCIKVLLAEPKRATNAFVSIVPCCIIMIKERHASDPICCIPIITGKRVAETAAIVCCIIGKCKCVVISDRAMEIEGHGRVARKYDGTGVILTADLFIEGDPVFVRQAKQIWIYRATISASPDEVPTTTYHRCRK